MCTQFPGGEELASTRPLVVFIAGGVIIVDAVKFNREIVKSDSLGFLSVSIGLFNLTDQIGLHSTPPNKLIKHRPTKPGALFSLIYNNYGHSGILITVKYILPFWGWYVQLPACSISITGKT